MATNNNRYLSLQGLQGTGNNFAPAYQMPYLESWLQHQPGYRLAYWNQALNKIPALPQTDPNSLSSSLESIVMDPDLAAALQSFDDLPIEPLTDPNQAAVAPAQASVAATRPLSTYPRTNLLGEIGAGAVAPATSTKPSVGSAGSKDIPDLTPREKLQQQQLGLDKWDMGIRGVLGAAQLGLGLWSAHLATQNQRQQLAFANRNLANQANLLNTAREDVLRGRQAADRITDDKANNERLKERAKIADSTPIK